ncbi:hypothetical protein C8F04DRAFT_1201733 [Mycena alexandri]|uniref:Uncharacterized protein n=1 Tax=Mycena alexandri TaxID=1745969 RepID=A0AAD6RX89_9AGAR|nr:hypothetical protein C8F04DRAFT_1201733 [Mycena alexandri]
MISIDFMLKLVNSARSIEFSYRTRYMDTGMAGKSSLPSVKVGIPHFILLQVDPQVNFNLTWLHSDLSHNVVPVTRHPSFDTSINSWLSRLYVLVAASSGTPFLQGQAHSEQVWQPLMDTEHFRQIWASQFLRSANISSILGGLREHNCMLAVEAGGYGKRRMDKEYQKGALLVYLSRHLRADMLTLRVRRTSERLEKAKVGWKFKLKDE